MDKALAQAVRLLCWIVGAVAIAWAARMLWTQAAEGTLTGALCLPFACGVAGIVAGAGIGTRYQSFVLWSATAVIGQAVTLQMIDAGRMMHYQHYEPLSVLWRTRPWLLAYCGVQSAIVGIVLARRGHGLMVSSRGSVKGWQLAAGGILSLSTAATVSPTVSRYISELLFAAGLQLLGAATILVAVMAFPAERLGAVQRWFDRIFGSPDAAPDVTTLRPDRIAWSCAGAVTIVAAALSVFSYQRHPHIKDEVVYLYHARYLAAGMLTMPAPAVPEAFDIELMNFEAGRWFCPVPPGWPAVLAVGVAAGAPWLVNPILGGLNVLLMFMLLLHLYGRRTARLAALLLCLSPWYAFLAMSFMTHTLTLTCALLAALGIVQARRTGRARWALLAGCAVGATALIRPLDGIILGAPIALWSIGMGGARLKIASLAALLVGTVGMGSLVFPYNKMLTGQALVFPINAYNDKYHGHNSNAYGFGADRGMGWAIDPYPGHGPLDATINANLNTFSINTELFGWSSGSLIFVALLLCSMSINRSDRLMLGVIATVFVAYFFYYFSGGPDFGARYWFLMIVPLIALTVRGIEWLQRTAGGARVALAVLVLSVLAVVNHFPWRAVDKYYHYLDMGPELRQIANEHRFDGALVLIRGERFPDYESGAIQNPIDLASDAPIYAWDRDANVRAAVLRAYSNRPVFLVDGPSRTHSRYRVAQGPVPAASVLLQSRSMP